MPFVAVPNTALAEIQCLWRGQKVENTIWAENVGGPYDAVSIQALALTIGTWFTDTYLTLISNEVEFLQCLTTDEGDPLGPTGAVSGSGSTGGAPTPSQANNVTLAITFKTAGRGRSFHGRNYIIGVPGTVVSGNDVDVGFRNDIRSAYASLGTALIDAGFSHVVASRFTGFTIVDGKKVPTPRAVGIATPVTSYTFFDSVVDAQRRRLPGRGK
jgi:hypothetical protein